jgi:glycosyltransferase involved in cell wall biosynthesis
LRKDFQVTMRLDSGASFRSDSAMLPAPGYAAQPFLPLPAHRKRIAITAPTASNLISHCHGIILDMVNRGHRVFAFTGELTNQEMRILSHIGAEAYAIAPLGEIFDRYRQVRELASTLRDVDADVVIVQCAHKGANAIAAARLARAHNVVSVVPTLGPSFMEGASRSAWPERQAMKAYFRTAFGLSDAVIFHSAHDLRYALDYHLLSKNKPRLVVGGWGEDLQRNVQRQLPPIDRGVLFLMASPLDHWQGIAEYCEAAKSLRLKARRARFFLASPPGEVVSPFSLAELKRYREFVQYIGPVDDAASLVSRCHAVVAPSYGNGAPRVLFQALALGRPIITTDTRSCRDFVRQGVNGFTVPVRDTDSLARAMTQILQRPDRIPLMAEESRRIALRFYDINAVNALVLEALGL